MNLRMMGNAMLVAVGSLAIGCVAAWAAASTWDDPKTLDGAWEGKLAVAKDRNIRLILKIEKSTGEHPSVVLDSPDEGLFDLALDPVEATGGKLKLGIKLSKATVEGELNTEGDTIVGKFTQGRSLPLTFKRVDLASLPKAVAVPAELEGLWEGTLKIQAGLELRLVLNVSKQADGSFKAVLDSPDQNANGLPITSLDLKDGALKFESKPLRASFEGKVNAEKSAYEGTFTQGRKMPLILKKTDKVAKLNRPQHPEPPFPYDEEKVAYENKDGGVKLAGTLTTPKGDGPFPAVILITGSGPQDRDETLLGHKPFLVLADFLTRRGIAVLRVDDRGVGGSTGNITTSTSADFAGDVLAGVSFLKAHAKIDGRKIGLCGHSEGGVVAPIAAERSNDVAFIVLMAGTGVPGLDVIRLQSRLISKAMGATERALELSQEISDKTFAVLAAEPDDAAAMKKMKEITEKALASLSDVDRKSLGDDGDAAAIDAQLKQVVTPWFRFFLTYDPRATLAKVKCPVLAINGEKDLQVIPGQNLPEIDKALRGGGNERVTIVEMKGLNHLFQACETGAPTEYAKIEETMAPAALQVIGDWIAAQTELK